MKHAHYKHLHKLLFLLAGFLILATGIQCSGLIKLNIPPEQYNNPDDGWLTPYKNNLRHNSVAEDVLPPYKISWKKRYRSVIPDQPLAVGNYLIFTVKNGMLAIFDLEKGEKIGEGRLAPGFYHSPVLSDNILYYSANLGNETLGAFDLSILKNNWKDRLPQMNTTPVLWEKKLFAGADDGNFFCMDRENGEKVWEFKSGSSVFGIPASMDKNVYFSNVDGKVICLNGQSGAKVWESALMANFYAGPLIAGDAIVIGSTSGIIYSLDAQNGEIRWQVQTQGSIYGNAAYRSGVIYVGNNSHQFLALDAASGKILWEFKTGGINNSTPVVGPNFVYFGSWDKFLYVLDRKSGKLIYRQEFRHPLKSSLLIYRDNIYLHTANDQVYCLVSDNTASQAGEDK